jgi:hypothetical protein
MTDAMTVGEIRALLAPVFAVMLEPAEFASLEWDVVAWGTESVLPDAVIPEGIAARVEWRILGETGRTGSLRTEDPRTLVRFVQSDLQDFIAESAFGWGQLRGPADLA